MTETKTIETTVVLPVRISQNFNKDLLSISFPLFSAKVWTIYSFIKLKLERKSKCSKEKYQKFAELERRFLDLYEWAKAEEENPKKLPNNKAQGSLYFPWFVDRGRRNLYFRLEQEAWRFFTKHKYNSPNEKGQQ